MASSYNSSSLASYGTAVLDPLLQASSLASAASAQTTSGGWLHSALLTDICHVKCTVHSDYQLPFSAACFWKEMGKLYKFAV